MSIKVFVMSLLLLFSLEPCFAQEITVAELQKKLSELEKRIELLEKIISKPKSGEITDSQVFNKTIWRKLRVRMKEKDVIALLGEPTHITRYSPELCTWIYIYGKSPGTISFNANGVSSWIEPY